METPEKEDEELKPLKGCRGFTVHDFCTQKGMYNSHDQEDPKESY